MGFSFKKSRAQPQGAEGPKKPLFSKRAPKAEKLKKPSKPRGFGFSKGSKYTLFIGDEGAILVYIQGRIVKNRHFVADASEKNLKELHSLLSQDVKAPLLVVIDSMDQSFVQQTLPPISSLGVGKLIEKRLARDLPADAIKGSVMLERDKTGRKDWNFLMVSIDKTPHMTTWLDFIDNVDNRVKGLYLASIESEILIKTLDKAMQRPKKEKPAVWKFFVSHNKVGGFRQVVLKNGRIVFTRLGQPIGESTPSVIAGNIEQEISSTTEYMKRLSFNPQEGLDVYIIASAEINAALETSRFASANVFKFTPFEVAEFIGIAGATQPTDQFGDVIMAASIGCSRNHILTLSTPHLRKVAQVYHAIVYERAFAGLAVLGMLIYGGMLGFNALENYSQTADLEQKKNVQQRNLDALKEEVKLSSEDIRKVNETVMLYNGIIEENRTPVQLLMKVRANILPAVAIRKINWSGNDTLQMDLRFPEMSATDEAFTLVARKLLKDLRAAFPEYQVTYSKLPESLLKKPESGTITLDEKSDAPVAIAASQLEASITMTKQGGGAAPAAASAPPGRMPGGGIDPMLGARGGPR